MARNFNSPLLQRPGMVDPQERRRRPLNPLEDYPYEPEMPEVPMPQMGALPVPDISPGMAAPRLAPVNPTGWDTPPRDLSQFRAWYSGQPVEGAPAAPEWGRDTQTYSRLNPVEPKTTPERTIVPPRTPKMPTAGQTLGGGQPQVMQRPRGPVRPNAPMPSFNAPMGQQAMEQMQAREQRFFTPQQGPTMAAGMQQVTRAGGGVQPLANQARRQMLGQAANNLAVVPEAGSARQAVNQFAQSLGTGLAGIPRGLAAAAEETFGAGSPVPENWRQRTAVAPPRALSQALKEPTQAAQRSIQQAFPVNPQDQSWLTSKIPAGFGSAGAFMTAAGLGRLTGAPINAITGAAGVGMSVDQFLNEVEQTGIDPKRYSAGVKVATASGLSELVGFGNLLDKFGLKRPVLERGLDALKDGGQEAFQGYLEDLNRKYVAANAPQTNVDVTSADFWFKRGEEFGLGTIVSAPFALIPGRDGGVSKVPDAIESETTPGGTGATTRIPQSEQQRRYSDWVAAGGTPVPFASRVGLRRPRQLPGRGALPGTPEGQRALPPIPTQPEPPSARVEAPFPPSPPTAPTGIRPQTSTEARPVTSAPSDVSFRPLETVGAPGARPVRLYERPILQSALQGQGIEVQAEIEDKLPALADEYEAKVEAARAKGRKYTKAEPGPGDVKGEYGMAASRMHRTADAILEKFMEPLGIEARGQRRSIYPEVLSNITAEMQEIVPGVTESDVESAAKAGTKAEGRMREGVYDIWEQWHERFGREKGLSEQDTLAMKNLVAGRKGLFFRPDVQAALGLTPGDPTANKQVHDVIRQDMAKLTGMPTEVQGKPLKGLSLSLISPQVWRNWMSLRGLNDETKFPGFREEMEDILRNHGRISDSVVRGESAPTPPVPTKPKAPPSPVTPQAPPSPAAPVAPSAPSAPPSRQVSFDGKSYSLTAEQAKAWDKANERYELQLGRAKQFEQAGDIDGAVSIRKGAGMKLSAERREITGALTDKEAAKKTAREQGNYIDKPVSVDGRNGKVKGNPFGKVIIEYDDTGRRETVSADRVKPPVTSIPKAPPSPTAPVAPSGPSATLRQYQGMTERGMPGAPRTFASGIPSRQQGPGFTRRSAGGVTTGRPQGPQGIRGLLPDIDQETREEREARAARERLKSRSPFARGRQAEQERIGQAIEGRRPPTPPEAVTPAPAPPTPPPAPTPAGEAVTPSKSKAAPVKKEPTPKPAPKPAALTGQPINEKTLTDRGWTKQKPDAYSGPNGEKLERDADRRGEPWVYTDRAGNTQGFPSAREAIKAIISEPEAVSTPPTPTKAKPAAKKAKPATPPAAEPTPVEPAAAKGVETAPAGPRLTKPKPEMPPRGLPLLFEFRRLNPNLITTLEGYRDSLTGPRRAALDELLQLRQQKEDSKKLERQEASRAFPNKAQQRLRKLNEEFKDAEFNIQANAGLARFISAAVYIPAREIKATEYRPAITLPKGYVLEGDRYVYKPSAVKPTPTEPAAAKGVETAPAEVKEIFREIDAGKNKRTVRRRVQDDYKDGKKALFVADNIEQIIAEAEATGKVTKVCP